MRNTCVCVLTLILALETALNMRSICFSSFIVLLFTVSPAVAKDAFVDETVVFEEAGGLIAVEAEHYFKQTHADVRAWHLTTAATTPKVTPDGDPPHVGGASGGAYLEALPDTRRTHGDKLIHGENFQNTAGKMAILHYNVHINTPGRYYVWARTHSTGTEDNGLHVGIDGTWPDSGQRMQWTAKRRWFWDSKQRTQKVHTGVPHQLYLDIETTGPHVISFSMREDGFEFDKWLMTTRRGFSRPKGVGPAPRVKSGVLPAPFPFVPASAVEPADGEGESAPVPAKAKVSGGDGSIVFSGERATYHKITLTQEGPHVSETDVDPNPFLDYRMTVTFRHEKDRRLFEVPGYFAADGNAAETSASVGNSWRVHFAPALAGLWYYRVSFVRGENVAIDPTARGEALAVYDGVEGQFVVEETTKTGRDFRGRGRLEYVGKRYLRAAHSREYFLKAGPDAPETLLAYTDFDDAKTKRTPLKTWAAHERDWRDGDPTWKGGKGKGLIGALNYLASKGCNVVSFLPYNVGGDGQNVWPFVAPDDKLHYDCSKLDQWQIVFDHAQSLGIYLHFKLQEQEMDDDRSGHKTLEVGRVPASLDGGALGVERRLYCRELVARFGYELALNWNLGEENTQSPAEQRAMASYLREIDPYDHHIVVHTFPDQQDKVFSQLLGERSVLTGASLQNAWDAAHRRTLQWVNASTAAGRPWVVANDEQGPASMGVPPDPGYEGSDGTATLKSGRKYNLHDVRKHTLWGTLMAGGAGVEYYFGYKLPQNDLICEDFRSRDKSWDYCHIALDFFRSRSIPFWDMQNANELVGNTKNQNTLYCFAKPGAVYLVYLCRGGTAKLDLSGAAGTYSVRWFDPRSGGGLQKGSVAEVRAGSAVELGSAPSAPSEDWLVVVRRQ